MQLCWRTHVFDSIVMLLAYPRAELVSIESPDSFSQRILAMLPPSVTHRTKFALPLVMKG